MIGWTIEAALGAQHPSRVIVSTDDVEIAEVAKAFGAEVPFLRPSEFSTDTASPVDAVLHALDWLARTENFFPNAVLLLQPTSPLRTSEDIDAVVDLFQKRSPEAVVSVGEVRHPVAWLRKIGSSGELLPWRPDLLATRRQNSETLYQLNGAIYFVGYDVLLQKKTFLPESSLAYVMPPERSIDIDVPWEFHLAELVLRDKYAR